MMDQSKGLCVCVCMPVYMSRMSTCLPYVYFYIASDALPIKHHYS